MSVESFSKLMEEYADKFKPKWVSVEDELPNFGYQYIVSLEFSEPCTVCAVFDEGQFTCAETEEVFTNVSHWMPLPEPPKPTT